MVEAVAEAACAKPLEMQLPMFEVSKGFRSGRRCGVVLHRSLSFALVFGAVRGHDPTCTCGSLAVSLVQELELSFEAYTSARRRWLHREAAQSNRHKSP